MATQSYVTFKVNGINMFYQTGVKDVVGGVETLLLDDYSGASAAYSLKKLRTGYTGSCIRVRRSSDNTEQNIGFVNNVLDISSLLSFVGSGNGFITTWFDQTTNGYNQTQTSATLQPKIVNSGTLLTSGGKAAIQFDGTDDYLTNFNTGLGTSFSGDDRACSVFTTAQPSVANQSTPVSFARKLTSTALEQIVPFGLNTTNTYFYKRDNSGVIKSYNFSGILLSQQLISMYSNGIALNVKQNGTSKISNADVNVATITIDNLSLGALSRNTVSNYYNGFIQEVVVWQSDQTSNVSGIESKINS